MIAFIGSVFSPYYHWSGRRDPQNHIAFNVALYQPVGAVWAMTERGGASLKRSVHQLSIGESSMERTTDGLLIRFDEMALPWPGQRLWPKRVTGQIAITFDTVNDQVFGLHPSGRHQWLPVAPSARVVVTSDAVPEGGWQGHAYHDINAGSRPVEEDFVGWDWARGLTDNGDTLLLYDCQLAGGGGSTMALCAGRDGGIARIGSPEPQILKKGVWGVGGAIACDADARPEIARRLEDTPFYTRSLVSTRVSGETVSMVHETLDCRRLANPFVRMMLPFRMPRRSRG